MRCGHHGEQQPRDYTGHAARAKLERERAQQVCLRSVVFKDHCIPVMNVQAIRCSESETDALQLQHVTRVCQEVSSAKLGQAKSSEWAIKPATLHILRCIGSDEATVARAISCPTTQFINYKKKAVQCLHAEPETVVVD